ncbi:MAG TPA: phosphotransferase [Bryobacteraceae bacterium]|nr:phosphotransferase [Bryobacteraceae bacterium]
MKRAITSPRTTRLFASFRAPLKDFTQEIMSEAPQFERQAVEEYLRAVLGGDLRVVDIIRLGAPEEGKNFGYGVPLRVDYEIAGRAERAVLHSMSPGSFGHEHMADRARILLWSHPAFNRLPRHVRSLDVGAFQSQGGIVPLAAAEEFCQLTECVEGEPYAVDLERLRDSGSLTDLDVQRADALCDYLAEIHSETSDDARLYIRRNRELVGDGECIMGLADSYPEHPLFTPQVLEQIEHRAVAWRWRLKDRTHRLRQVHGDFHPWNILFASGADFRVLDRSRGEYGDPADDVTCITLNYVFFSLQKTGKLEGAFEHLFLRFWDRYLEKTGDREILEVAAPFFVFRALVLASPVWYPDLADSVRAKLRNFILAIMEQPRFDPREVNAYCGA